MTFQQFLLSERAFSLYFGIQTPKGDIVVNEDKEEIHDDIARRIKLGNIESIIRGGGVKFDRGGSSWSIVVDYRFIPNLKKFLKSFVNEDSIYLDVVDAEDYSHRRPWRTLFAVETNKNRILKMPVDQQNYEDNRRSEIIGDLKI